MIGIKPVSQERVVYEVLPSTTATYSLITLEINDESYLRSLLGVLV